MPAGRLLRRSFEHILQHAHVTFGVGLVVGDERAGLVTQLAHDRIDDLDVRAVAVDEDQAPKPMMDQRTTDVVDEIQIGLDTQSDGAGALAGRLEVLRAVAHPQSRRIENAGLAARAPCHFIRGDAVAEQRQVRAVLLQRGLGDQNGVAVTQILLDIGRTNVAEAPRGKFQVKRLAARSVRFVLVAGLYMNIRSACFAPAFAAWELPVSLGDRFGLSYLLCRHRLCTLCHDLISFPV